MHKLIAVVDHLAFDCVTGTAAVESADTGVVFSRRGAKYVCCVDRNISLLYSFTVLFDVLLRLIAEA